MRKATWLRAAAVTALALSSCGDEQPRELNSEAVAQWLGELASADASVRRHAVESLGAAWPQSARSVPVLSEALDDDDAGVRSAAESSLEALANRGWPYLHEFPRDEKDQQRQGLLSAVDSIRELGARVTPRNGAELMEVEPRSGLVFLGLVWGFTPAIDRAIARMGSNRRH